MATNTRALLVSALFFVGCGGDFAAQASAKYIDFKVEEHGEEKPVKKFFMDGFSDKDPRNHAFWLAQNGKMPDAKQTLTDAIAKDPKDKWLHYDLAILHEATGDWANATTEIKTAAELDPKEDRIQQELKFVALHKP